ncbi:FAD-binding domain-containing protein [Teratosphaeria nubilosa]|uniref:FAD-binding domain-containing protein n=1 Tax=Teratosphaeria nubilosa TaxID=161662 RepID=A0A6G1LLS1_9PEZI|nr:FAD-binding domain-containing protein [Teratosphaeria nubilosa]
MSSQSQQIEELRSMLPRGEVFNPDQPEYKLQSQPWSNYAELHPKMVMQPTTLTGLQKVVKYLYDSDLDFAIRNTGTGSVSAQDVIISMHGFKMFDFDQAAGTVVLGGGLDWGEADRLMDSRTPDYALVGARCSWVGVAGSTLVGGLSWLSQEFGVTSDPQNLLDVQVVCSGRAKSLTFSGRSEVAAAILAS